MTALSVFALTAGALWFKMTTVAMIQGISRIRSNRYRRPEDASYFGGEKGVVDDHPLAILGQAVLQNDLETIPLFLLLLLAFALLGGDALPAALYSGAFVIFRLIHTAAYLRPTQPTRNRAFAGGVTASLILMSHVGYLAINHSQ